MSKNRDKIFKISLTGVLSSISVVLMILEFPIPIFPKFYQINISEVPALVASIFISPIYGVVVIVIKDLVCLIIRGTVTAGIGELSSMLVGTSLVLSIAYGFKYLKNKKRLLISLGLGILTIGVMGAFINYFISLRAIAYSYSWPLQTIINMGTVVNPAIYNLFTFVLFATLPFNILKGLLVSSVYFIIHKTLYERYKVTKE